MQKEEKKPRGAAQDNLKDRETAANSAGQAENTDEKTTGNEANLNKGTMEELEKKNSELNDKYLRLYSEYDNYRKRTIREKADIIKTAGEDVLKAMLPVIDDFERALRANESATDLKAVSEGMSLIYNKLRSTMQQKGLQAFESVGQPFDPELMEAISHIPADEKHPAGTVMNEVEKGYRMGDKVIRYAKVIVAQ